MDKDTIRTFIAIRLPAAATAVLADVAQQMAADLPRRAVRWVRPEQIHLTLTFLGDTAVSQVTAVAQMLDAACRDVAPFSLHLGKTGCFPHRRRPRVVWAGLDGDEAALAQLHGLQAAIKTKLVPLGWKREKRPFRPHLTLGRIKDRQKASRLRWDVAVEPVNVPVTAVDLVQSTLTPAGAVYRQLHTSRLGNQAVI